MKRAHARKWRVLKWCGWSALGVTVLAVVSTTAALGWLAEVYTRQHPLVVTHWVPKFQSYLLPAGVSLSAGNVELFFDGGPVLRVNDLQVRGQDGALAVVVEQAAIKLANRRLMLLQVAPKQIEATGVTFRLERTAAGLQLAGLKVGDAQSTGVGAIGGVVEWLNQLDGLSRWARLKKVSVNDLTLLLRDRVQQAEWVMENGDVRLTRFADTGEQGALTATVRRLYGAETSFVPVTGVVPVLVTFEHQRGAPAATVMARLDNAEVAMMADYFPPNMRDLLRAQGEVAVGTQLLLANKLGQPWVSLHLKQVTVVPPRGFTKALEFPELRLTASYVPAEVVSVTTLSGTERAQTVSGTDVLLLRELDLLTARGNRWLVSGTVTDVTTDPLVNIVFASPGAQPGTMLKKNNGGDVQGVFDFFPDERPGMKKALKWLRPNIISATYADLSGRYVGRPSAFPGCGNACGELEISATLVRGGVRFMRELEPVFATAPGMFKWHGQQFTVTLPTARLGQQLGRDVRTTLTEMFSPSPTHVLVRATLLGEAREVMQELAKLDGAREVPQDVQGMHVSELMVDVPLPHGAEPTFRQSMVQVSSTVTDFALAGLPALAGATLRAPQAQLSLDAAKNLRLRMRGTLTGQPLRLDWIQNIQPGEPHLTQLSVDGAVSGEWLMKKLDNPTNVSLVGAVKVALNAVEDAQVGWRFGLRADAAEAKVAVTELNYRKNAGDALVVEGQGILGSSGSLVLKPLSMSGTRLNVAGRLRWDPLRPDATEAVLQPMVLGATRGELIYVDGVATVKGKTLDARGIELFSKSEKADRRPKNLRLQVQLDELLTQEGTLNAVQADLRQVQGQWDVEQLLARIANHAEVKIRLQPLPGKTGRRKLVLRVTDLGLTLNTLDIYDKLRGGTLVGEVVYENNDVGSGLLRMEGFELKNPPLLMKLLSLLSLQQLVAGTDTTLFTSAVIPVRVNKGVWYFDKVNLEGPSMSIRLDGAYLRNEGVVNFDGRLAPAIPMNRLVAKIPLLGTLLTGSQDGVVVADFKIKGPVDDAEVTVRPLSVLTPGLLKDVFRGITGNQ